MGFAIVVFITFSGLATSASPFCGTTDAIFGRVVYGEQPDKSEVEGAMVGEFCER